MPIYLSYFIFKINPKLRSFKNSNSNLKKSDELYIIKESELDEIKINNDNNINSTNNFLQINVPTNLINIPENTYPEYTEPIHKVFFGVEVEKNKQDINFFTDKNNNNNEVEDIKEEKKDEGNSFESDEDRITLHHLRKNKNFKENFYKLKKMRFFLNMFEYIRFYCCCKSESIMRKEKVLLGGKNLITEKLDVISILRKNVEFDRFKKLMLRDYQLILLNSINKFMLDPERANLVSFENCNYDKFIDCYEEALNSESIIDLNLIKLLESKFQIDKFIEN